MNCRNNRTGEWTRTRRHRRWHVVGAGVTVMMLALMLVVTGCGGSSTATTTVGTTPSSTGGPQVIMKNIAFVPATLTIKVGQTVTWVNQDSVQHDVVANKGEFKSPLFGQGGTFSHTFTTAGTYAYRCSIHPNMLGTIIVQ